MKKIIAIVLLLALSITLFAGCSSNTDEKTENNSQTQTEPAGYKISGTVPQSSAYILSTGEMLVRGDELPEPKKGDILQSGDYRYCFEKVFDEEHNMWIEDASYKGQWSVHILDVTKSEYGDVAVMIAGKTVKITDDLYKDCKNKK